MRNNYLLVRTRIVRTLILFNSVNFLSRFHRFLWWLKRTDKWKILMHCTIFNITLLVMRNCVIKIPLIFQIGVFSSHWFFYFDLRTLKWGHLSLHITSSLINIWCALLICLLYYIKKLLIIKGLNLWDFFYF
jgi:hypothetical protein